ncbi:MAG: glycosyltransferase family 4 protein [Deltaproteobacteria bacterium]|nr:glycosyltransferase family 4 protein [Deltaproteobacteria bacterium]
MTKADLETVRTAEQEKRTAVNLKIAYISDERFPSVHTDTQQVMKTMDALGKAGVQVDFIQPRMWKHLSKSAAERKQNICDYYNVDGHFQIRDILLWPASDLRVEKFFHGIAAPLKAALGQYDVVYTRNLLPLLVASGLRAPILFETYRALPNTDPQAFRLVKLASRGSRFVGISTHSEYSRQIMIQNGIPQEMIQAIPNGFDHRDFDIHMDMTSARQALQMSETEKIIAYTGHIRPDKGVDSLLDVAHECSEVTMLIVGGSEGNVAQLKQTVENRRLTNVKLVGQVPIREVPKYLAAADLLILPPSSIPLKNATVLPMKTFTYLAAGKPILAPDQPDTQGVLVNESNCLTVVPDVPEAAAKAVRRILNDPALSRRLGEQARKDASLYTWDGRAANVVRFVRRRLSRS